MSIISSLAEFLMELKATIPSSRHRDISLTIECQTEDAARYVANTFKRAVAQNLSTPTELHLHESINLGDMEVTGTRVRIKAEITR